MELDQWKEIFTLVTKCRKRVVVGAREIENIWGGNSEEKVTTFSSERRWIQLPKRQKLKWYFEEWALLRRSGNGSGWWDTASRGEACKCTTWEQCDASSWWFVWTQTSVPQLAHLLVHLNLVPSGYWLVSEINLPSKIKVCIQIRLICVRFTVGARFPAIPLCSYSTLHQG